ncbi:hypothetical protein SODALDRAFT_355198 [Sodiomyces alkalinus F11]|uniref:Uncharacterized protein n=1 Tax=Sodiomyces alkalinus (strain CBS 110278 / VKM F-3762 / F11) TaxID=1314773 RepID=A0A3N2Q8N0_SODAK|nr:hypothetical protein SODALDRAFT_355198 [Sodiomyces alkalinus F11]ROT43008.1 hypothetical protein SODALDRAFT_355198 [Sodiomyces alkalinus F11]
MWRSAAQEPGTTTGFDGVRVSPEVKAADMNKDPHRNLRKAPQKHGYRRYKIGPQRQGQCTFALKNTLYIETVEAQNFLLASPMMNRPRVPESPSPFSPAPVYLQRSLNRAPGPPLAPIGPQLTLTCIGMQKDMDKAAESFSLMISA